MSEEFAQYFEVYPVKGKPEVIKATFEGGGTNILAKHPEVTVLASKLAKYFKDSGATNYVELQLQTPEYGDLIVTVQRKLGKTPHQCQVESEQKVAELQEEMERLRAELAVKL